MNRVVQFSTIFVEWRNIHKVEKKMKSLFVKKDHQRKNVVDII